MSDKLTSTLSLGKGAGNIKSTFQIAPASCPLKSIAKICDNGNAVTFSKGKGVVKGQRGADIRTFHRKHKLHVANLVIRRQKLAAQSGNEHTNTNGVTGTAKSLPPVNANSTPFTRQGAKA